MKFALASDLHLEFGLIELFNTDNADTLILSGDIIVAADLETNKDNLLKFFSECSERFQNVIYILGNHEHYSSDFAETLVVIKSFLEQFKNIHVLEKDSVTIDNITIIGGTLWTDMNKEDPQTLYVISRMMNDFKYISYENNTRRRKFTPENAVDEHKEMLKFIDNLYKKTENNIIVVGHHAPSKLSIKEKYRADFHVNGGYSSDLTEFILDHPRIKIWTHGHTHDEYDYIVGETRILCNPRGYIGYEEQADKFNLKFFEL